MRRLALLLLLAGAWLGAEVSVCSQPAPNDAGFQSFRQRAAQRRFIDAQADEVHRLEPFPAPGAVTLYAAGRNKAAYLRVLPHQPTAIASELLALGSTNPPPLRGFRAPLLGTDGQAWRRPFPAPSLTVAQRRILEIIQDGLPKEGLLVTVARALEVLGPTNVLANPNAAIEDLRQLGCPVDWLHFFDSSPGVTNSPPVILQVIASDLAQGKTVAALTPRLKEAVFRFAPSHPSFRLAMESGETEFALLRMQLDGGMRSGGFVAGGNPHVMAQLALGLPGANFIISSPAELLDTLHSFALQSWPLRRTNQVTIITEPNFFDPWAQDNAKAGTIRDPAGTVLHPATLASRYASQGEDESVFFPAQTFLLDGLPVAGHARFQSPLLFQGGNLLGIYDPKTKRRLLLLGEAEVYRNVGLGLTREQVLEAFRVEFDVDQCVVLASPSYHLDFDLTVRAVAGENVAFVNDPPAAARIILACGLAALQKHGSLTAETARLIREALAAKNDHESVRLVSAALKRSVTADGTFTTELTRFFSVVPTDSSGSNFRCFLGALDVLRADDADGYPVAKGVDSRAYHQALHGILATLPAQIQEFEKLGWRVVRVPSLPDFPDAINCLNGLQGPNLFVMPSYGGLYAPLDEAAKKVFQQSLGETVRILPVLTTSGQRVHGGVHCMTAVYPVR